MSLGDLIKGKRLGIRTLRSLLSLSAAKPVDWIEVSKAGGA